MRRATSWLVTAMALALTGCGGPPSSLDPIPPAASMPDSTIRPADNPVPGAASAVAAERYLAFTACRRDNAAGGLFLWDAALQDVYVLNGAIAGLGPLSKDVAGPRECMELAQLNPRAFGTGKVLFSYGPRVFVYDMVTEERIVAATDGRPFAKGGPRAVITQDGKLLAYVSLNGTLVLKPTHPVYATKTRELAKIAAELAAIPGRKGYGGVIKDFDLSGDGKCLVVNIDGAVYFYDVAHPRLYQVAPLDGGALAGQGDGFGHVALGIDGNLVACTIVGQRLLVFDRKRNHLDTVPYANLGDTVDRHALVLDPLFGVDGRSLYFEVLVGDTLKVWCYDVVTETLRALVILNNVLGEDTDDVAVSSPDLGN